jgi:hypothetical protein
MTQLAPVVFLLDVDNTLLDNDRVIEDLKKHLTQAFGVERQQRYWAIFEKHREELGYADYLGALQRYDLPALLPVCETGSSRTASELTGGEKS